MGRQPRAAGVIDLGTNTVLLLVGRLTGPERVEVLADVHAVGRLGEGVEREGRIGAQALARVQSIVARHARRAASLGVERLVAYGTSALRDAANRDEVCAAIERSTGVRVRLLDAAAEARWTYLGATWGMELPEQRGVLDIGGGSTEVAIGDRSGPHRWGSVDLGAVRLTERFFPALPPTPEQLGAARDAVRAALAALPAPSPCEPLVGVAGTVTTLGALDLGLHRFEPALIHGHLLPAVRVAALARLLQVQSYAALRAMPAVSAGRADLITAGALILDTALQTWGHAGVRVSTQGLRYGLLLRELLPTLPGLAPGPPGRGRKDPSA